MKIKKFNESLNVSEEEIERIGQLAQEYFWAEVADNFAANISGDFPPDATFEFDAACEKAIKIWISYNIK